jgi:hypothetical protein
MVLDFPARSPFAGAHAGGRPTSVLADTLNSGNSPHAMLVRELARSAQSHAARRARPGLARALERLAAWQASRMGRTYTDLAMQSRYADAIAFFQSDLYGAADFAQRDADLARVVPIMTRMLPGRVIATIAQAMELNALSQEIDLALLERLPRPGGIFTVAEYCLAYRLPGDRPARERQIGLIGEIGAGLDDYVRRPLIHSALVLMRRPARLAGLSVLHDFLERGFVAFRKMHGATEFLATIDRRERELMEAIFSGATAPFPEPLLPAPSAAGGGERPAAGAE